MARQSNKMMMDSLEDVSKNVRDSVDRAGDSLRKTGEDIRVGVENFRDGVTKGYQRGTKMVKDHPVAVAGVAVGVAFAAGALAGSSLERRAKSRLKANSKGKAA